MLKKLLLALLLILIAILTIGWKEGMQYSPFSFKSTHMTEKEHNELIELYVDNIKRFINESGGLFPHITIFADKLEDETDDKKALIHVPIPDSYMETDADKDSLVDEILPFIFEKVKERFNPYGVAWASEAWMRVIESDEHLKNYKNIPPKKEVVVISIDTDCKSETIVYEMKRKGYQVNSEGEFVDDIELTIINENNTGMKSSGRFVGLYQKLKLC